MRCTLHRPHSRIDGTSVFQVDSHAAETKFQATQNAKRKTVIADAETLVEERLPVEEMVLQVGLLLQYSKNALPRQPQELNDRIEGSRGTS